MQWVTHQSSLWVTAIVEYLKEIKIYLRYYFTSLIILFTAYQVFAFNPWNNAVKDPFFVVEFLNFILFFYTAGSY